MNVADFVVLDLPEFPLLDVLLEGIEAGLEIYLYLSITPPWDFYNHVVNTLSCNIIHHSSLIVDH